MSHSLDGRQFVVCESAHDGEVGVDTIFAYHERDGVIWADYSGGDIRRGHLIGTRAGDRVEFRYVQLNIVGDTSSGHCVSHVVEREDGRMQLNESWRWESRPGSGKSIAVEL